MLRIVVITLAALSCIWPASTQAEGPDLNFGMGGALYLPTLSEFGFSDVASGKNGSIAVLSPVNELAKLSPNGEVDPTFGEGGQISPVPALTGLGGPRSTSAVAYQGNRILVSGSVGPRPFIARITPEGSIDQSFGRGGLVLNRGRVWSRPRTGYEEIVVDSKGRIVVSGYMGVRSNILVRFHPNGSVDRSFGRKGRAVFSFNDRTDIPESGGLLATGGRGIVVLQATKSRVRVLRFSDAGVLRRNATITIPAGQPVNPVSFESPSGAITGGFLSLDPRKERINNAGHVVAFRLTRKGRLDNRFGNAGVTRFNSRKATRVFGKGSKMYFSGAFGLGGSAQGTILSTTAVRPGRDRRTVTFRLTRKGSVDRRFGSNGAFYTGRFETTGKLPVHDLGGGSSLVSAGGLSGAKVNQQHLYRFELP